MRYGLEGAKMVKADRVFLDQKNPRHEPFEDQDQAIEYLCRDEQVLTLAKDIAKNGLNPLELFALIKEDGDSYYAAEGNRRLCALKLLNDPELAPADQRNEFKRISESWHPIEELFSVVFKDRDEVRLWLDRIHAGSDEGRGRRQWRSDQKARNSIYSKNDLALAMLDLAQDRGILTSDERKGRLSTVQRYLSNPLMRNALGLETGGSATLSTNLPDQDFDIVFRSFIRDVADKKVTTRNNSSDIADYANKLGSLEGVSGERVSRKEINDSKSAYDDKKTKPKKPKRPPRQAKISPNDALSQALGSIPSYKLERIYFSLCSLTLYNHAPLLYVGAWSFLETLTALCGRNESVDFQSFLSAQMLERLGLGNGKKTKSIREAVKRISEYGNSTKHNKTSAGFNGDQLANDFDTMSEMLLVLAKEAKGRS